MSEPDNPRWLEDVGDELRAEVAVRPAWRAELLDEIARAPRPSDDDGDDRFDAPRDRPVTKRGRRPIVLSPFTGIAAAVVFAALGGALTYLTVSRVPVAAPPPSALARTSVGATPASDIAPVRFEISAPRASRVSVVGSFNEWNPQATPLVRDASTGTWTVSLRLPPGRHVYAFVVDGDVTADPAAPRAADDDFGSRNSVVLVSAPRT